MHSCWSSRSDRLTVQNRTALVANLGFDMMPNECLVLRFDEDRQVVRSAGLNRQWFGHAYGDIPHFGGGLNLFFEGKPFSTESFQLSDRMLESIIRGLDLLGVRVLGLIEGDPGIGELNATAFDFLLSEFVIAGSHFQCEESRCRGHDQTGRCQPASGC